MIIGNYQCLVVKVKILLNSHATIWNKLLFYLNNNKKIAYWNYIGIFNFNFRNIRIVWKEFPLHIKELPNGDCKFLINPISYAYLSFLRRLDKKSKPDKVQLIRKFTE